MDVWASRYYFAAQHLQHSCAGLSWTLPFFHRCGCIFAADHHWALFWGEGDHSHWTGTYVDGLPGSLHVHAERLASCLSTLKGHLHWTFDVSSIFPHEAPCTCGTIALLFLKVFLGLSVPHSPNVILDLRHLLLRSQPAICRSSELLIGLGPYPVEQQLAVLLQTKGFQLPERAAAAVQKLGAAADQAALQQKNPRKDLKLLTTKPGFGFQLVNKDELQQFIAPKAADQHGAVISSKKKQKPRKQERAGPSSRLPDPQQLQILPGHFVHRPGPGGSNVCRCHECSRQCRLLKGGSSPLQHRCVGTSCPGVRGYPC